MEHNYSYCIYDTFAFTLPLVLLTIGPTVIITVNFNFIFFLAYCCKKKKKYFWTFALKMLQLVYGDELQQNEGRFSLYGRPLERYKVPLLLAAVESIFICVSISFYSELLFTESNQCSNTMDCFASTTTTGFCTQAVPLPFDNCTKYQDEGFPIICFSFTFNYIQAIGNAGGVLIICAFVMKAQAGVVAALLALKDNLGKFGKHVIGIVLAVQVIIGLILLILPTSLVFLPAIYRSVYHSTNSSIQFLAYSSILPYLYTTTTYALLMDWPCMKNSLKFLGLC